jgi:hypothetical protein
MENKDEIKEEDIPNCGNCGEKLKPYLKDKNTATGEWSGHSFFCENCSPNLILSIG